MDSDEDNDVGGSWISVKSLKRAADVKASFKRQASPSINSYTSINSESLANPSINPSLSFSNVHKKYQEPRVADTPRSELQRIKSQIEQLQEELRNQEAHHKTKYRVMENYYQETERMRKVGHGREKGKSSLGTSNVPGRWLDHVDCQAEIETLKETVTRQEAVIDGLQNAVDTLHEKLAEAQQKHTPPGRTRRRTNLSSMQ